MSGNQSLVDHCNEPALSGKPQGMQAVSLAYSHRITLTVRITEHEILLLGSGKS